MSETIRVEDARRAAAELLLAAEIPQALFEADQITGHVLTLSRAALHTHPERTIAKDDLSRIVEMSIRRAAKEPLAHILGNSFFCGRSFRVTRDTLIPRPETEMLAMRADSLMKEMDTVDTPVFADWCTGGGCIAITLLAENPTWRAYAVDSSERALAVATENAALHGVLDRIAFLLHSTPEDAKDGIPPGSLDFVTANPPYIPTENLAGLEEQVRRYEPIEALDGGPDGLDVYRLLLPGICVFMKPGAHMLLETAGEEQASAIRAMYDKSGTCVGSTSQELELLDLFSDQRDIYRFMLWQKKG